MGYARAGFEVVGVDIKPQPHYPFAFVQGDALEALTWSIPGHSGLWAEQFDAIHTSPPCQAYSKAMRHLSDPQPELIPVVRELLQQTELPWIIENVEGSPLARGSTLHGEHGVELCGTQFGLRIGRHRLFESNMPLDLPAARCRCMSTWVINPHNTRGRERIYDEFGRGDPEAHWRKEMGVEWMGRYEAREAIPPAFAEFIGHQLLQHIRAEAVA